MGNERVEGIMVKKQLRMRAKGKDGLLNRNRKKKKKDAEEEDKNVSERR